MTGLLVCYRNTEIKTLPLNLGRLHNCWELTLHGLTLTNVPHHLMPGVRGGSAKRLLAYLRAQLRHCLPYNRMKLMAVGLQVWPCLLPPVNLDSHQLVLHLGAGKNYSYLCVA